MRKIIDIGILLAIISIALTIYYGEKGATKQDVDWLASSRNSPNLVQKTPSLAFSPSSTSSSSDDAKPSRAVSQPSTITESAEARPGLAESSDSGLCCYTVPGFSRPVRVTYSSLPSSVSYNMLDYYLRINFNKPSESDNSAITVHLSGKLHPDVIGIGDCSNAKVVELSFGGVTSTGTACSTTSNEQAERDATGDAVMNLRGVLLTQQR